MTSRVPWFALENQALIPVRVTLAVHLFANQLVKKPKSLALSVGALVVVAQLILVFILEFSSLLTGLTMSL
jgi:hypothetical protein